MILWLVEKFLGARAHAFVAAHGWKTYTGALVRLVGAVDTYCGGTGTIPTLCEAVGNFLLEVGFAHKAVKIIQGNGDPDDANKAAMEAPKAPEGGLRAQTRGGSADPQ